MSQARVMLLKGLNQEHQGRVFEVKDRLMMGRSRKCDVLLEDGLVSRNHAVFEVSNQQLLLRDLSSRNGTFLNQEPIEGQVTLQHGDKVRVGRSEFLFLDPNMMSASHFELVDDAEFTFSEPVIKKDLTINAAHITDSFLLYDRRGGSNDEHKHSEINASSKGTPQWFEVLFLINREIQTQSDIKELSLLVSQRLLSVLDGDRCVIALLNDEGDLELHSICEANPNPDQTSPVKLSRAITEQVIEGRCAINVNDISQDKRFEESDSLLLSSLRSFLVAPIMIGSQVIGLIEVSRSDVVNAFSEAGLDLLSVVGSMLAGAIKHTEQLKKREAHITELQEAQRQLELAQQDLVRSQQLAVLGRMASSINHEIGNLLMPLLEHHTTKAEDGLDDEDDFELFSSEELAYSCTQIKSLIEDIKHFSRGTDRLPQMSRCDLTEQVLKATHFVQIDQELFPRSGPNKVEFELQCEGHPKVIIDPLQIGRVIINLLRNAAQAMRGQEEPPRITIRVGANMGEAFIEITDNGPGIPEEVRNKLFEPFISTKGDQGLGLGLDISRKIVNHHGGTIDFTLGETRGTTFKISLSLNPTIKTSNVDLLNEVSSIPSLPTASDEL